MGVLVGRELEKKQLIELIGGVRQRGGALIVRGEAGVGKSAVVAAAAAFATAMDMHVLKTVGVDAEQHLPYAALQQVLRHVQAGIDTLPSPQRNALNAVLGRTDTSDPNVYLVGLATLNLLADVAASTPLLLIAEDVHSMDPSSADVLAFVARRLESEPVVLIATILDGERSRLDDAELATMVIERLPDSAAADLLDATAPGLAAPVRAQLLKAAAGNPLALSELPLALHSQVAVDAMQPSLPLTRRLERAFTARVAKLPAPTRMSLLIAAVNDSGSISEILDATASGLGVTVDVTVLTAAAEANLIELRPDMLTFRHPLMRSAIAQVADAVQRQAAHRALAAVLDGQPDRRAWHLAAATTDPDENLALDLELAAEHALRRGGVAAAVTVLERSAHLSENPGRRAERLLRAAELAVESGRKAVVTHLLDECRRIELTAQQQARSALVLSDFEDGMRATVGPRELAELAESVAADGDVELASRVLWSAAMRCFWNEPGLAARQRVLSVADRLFIDELDSRKVAISAYVAPFERGQSVEAGLRYLAARMGEDPLIQRLLGSAALQFGAFDLSARFSAASLPGLRAQGRLALVTRALAAHAWSSVRLGNLGAALAAAVEAGQLAQETDQPFMQGLSLAVQAEIAALRGQYGDATALAAKAEQIGLPVGARPILATVQLARGIAALGQGNYADAFMDLRRMHDPCDPAYQPALRCYSIAELVDAAIRTGQSEASREILSELEAFAWSAPSPALRIGLRYASAVLASGKDAEEKFKTALNANLVGWPLERGRIRLAFGEWLRRQRRAAQSRAYLRSARETFDALGVIPWSDRARHELRAAGEVSGRRDPNAHDRLTAQELNIAQLAAQGLTNREIGQRLYLSHRTVSTHLQRIFSKLGVSSRDDLGSALEQDTEP